MGGMPSRTMPGTYPAPPFECTISGLSRLSPSIPVPWSRLIFSSSVISLTTMDARSSGDKLVLLHGCFVVGDCAKPDEMSTTIANHERKMKESRENTRVRRDMGRPPFFYKIDIVAGSHQFS